MSWIRISSIIQAYLKDIHITRNEGKRGNNAQYQKISMAGLLVAMGVVYGDIGTSPLYVMKSIVEDNGGLSGINPDFVIGSVSLIFGH